MEWWYKMSKQLYSGRHILKINSSRLRNNDWNLKLTLDEARKNEELITLGDGQLLRFIRKLSGLEFSEEEIRKVKIEIKRCKVRDNNKNNKEYIKQLYRRLRGSSI